MFKVGETSKEYDAAMVTWDLPLALMGGTSAMRDEHAKFLPRWPMETDKHYIARVSSATLYNSFRRTVRVLSSKPFSEPVKVIEVPASLDVIEKDVDRNGLTLTQFSHALLTDMLTFGLFHYMVDNPEYSESTTRLDQMTYNIHPYFCRIRPDTIIYWAFEKDAYGQDQLVELHIRQWLVDRDNVKWCVITVWEPGMVSEFRKRVDSNEKEEFSLYSSNPNNLGYIPLVTKYSVACQTGLMTATSPLEDLAWLNLRHFQSQSDQDTALHYARVPFLHFAGFDKEEVERVVAANNAFVSRNPQSAIKWVEPTGSALQQGYKDLEMLETRMDVMGADLMLKTKSGNPTATATAIDTAEKVSDLQSMVVSVEGGVEQGYEFAADWAGDSSGVEPNVEMNKDFGLSLNDVAELNFLLQSRIAGEISRELFYAEIQRRGLFDEFDTEEELNRVANEDRAAAAKVRTPLSGQSTGAQQ